MRLFFGFTLFVSLFMMMACQPSRPGSNSNIALNWDASDKLIHGSTAAESSRFGLAMMIVRGEKWSTCSATIIGRRLILTAAHCLSHLQESPARLVLWRNPLTRDASGASQPSNTDGLMEPIAEIVRHVRHPLFRDGDTQNGYDLAVGYTDRDFPADMAPVALAPKNWLALPILKFYFVGAGSKHPNPMMDQTAQTLQQGDVTGETTVTRASYMGWMGDAFSQSPLSPGDRLVSATEGLQRTFICKGDSGGALVQRNDDGSSMQVGVLVTTYMRKFEGQPVCYGSAMTSVPVSAHADWIQKTMLDLSDSSSGATSTGRSSENR